jgi:hypothetical protein
MTADDSTTPPQASVHRAPWTPRPRYNLPPVESATPPVESATPPVESATTPQALAHRAPWTPSPRYNLPPVESATTPQALAHRAPCTPSPRNTRSPVVGRVPTTARLATATFTGNGMGVASALQPFTTATDWAAQPAAAAAATASTSGGGNIRTAATATANSSDRGGEDTGMLTAPTEHGGTPSNPESPPPTRQHHAVQQQHAVQPPIQQRQQIPYSPRKVRALSSTSHPTGGANSSTSDPTCGGNSSGGPEARRPRKAGPAAASTTADLGERFAQHLAQHQPCKEGTTCAACRKIISHGVRCLTCVIYKGRNLCGKCDAAAHTGAIGVSI